MKKILSLGFLILLQACLIGAGQNSEISSDKNNYFPQITGIDLNGNKQKLPDTFNNDLNLVIVAFKREQQSEVDTWIKSAKPLLEKNKNLSFFEIPLIYELSAFKRFWVNNGMRFGIKDEVARKQTITVYTNRKKFFNITKMEEEKIYALLIDKNGKILWQKDGASDAAKISSLKKALLTNIN